MLKHVGVKEAILFCMLLVHLVGLIRENKLVKMHGVSYVKI